jgi:hypothetical protein
VILRAEGDGRRHGWTCLSLSILGRFASKNSSFAAIAPRAPQGCGSGVHNEAAWTHRTRMIFRLYDTQGLGDADLEIGAPQPSFGE